ncbi:MAG: hypothetical protein ACK5XA_08645 [Tagaea sp.]
MSDADKLMTLVEQYAEQSAEYNTACSVGYNEREAGYACQRTEAAIREHIAEVERAARAAERDSISMELALIPNIYKRHDFANAFSRGVNECRERIVDRGMRARAEGQR